MTDSADLGQRNDAALLGWLNGARLGLILLECEMGARGKAVHRDTDGGFVRAVDLGRAVRPK